MDISEGKESKGGTNLPPTIPPPEPPKGQGGLGDCNCKRCGKFTYGLPVFCESCLASTAIRRPCRVCGKSLPEGIPVCRDCDLNFNHWPKNEEILRELLFMEHHCDAKYGDDGEMQCGHCRIDFRRDSAQVIKEKTEARNLERMRKWVEDHPNLIWTEDRQNLENGIPPGKLTNVVGKEGPCKCDGTGKHPIPGDLG